MWELSKMESTEMIALSVYLKKEEDTTMSLHKLLYFVKRTSTVDPR